MTSATGVVRAAAAARTTRRRRKAKAALAVAGVLLFLGGWELVSRTGLANPAFLPPVSEVLLRLTSDLGSASFWAATRDTMLQWLTGLVIAVAGGTALGLIIGSSRLLRALTSSVIEFLRPIPSVAFIPLAVLLFGVQFPSALLLIVYAAFWQVLIQVLYGVTDVDSVAMNTARSYGLGPLARVRYVVFPTALPFLITGVRLAASVALILAITAGLTIGTAGLGREISIARSSGAVVPMYALVIATGFIGVAINLVMRLVERRTLAWHSSIRSEVTR